MSDDMQPVRNRTWLTLAFLMLVYVVITTLIIGVAVGIGTMLHWLVPSIDFGIAMLCGVLVNLTVIIVTAIFYFPFALRTMDRVVAEDDKKYEDDSAGLPDAHIEILADQLSESLFERMAFFETQRPPRSRHRR